MSTPAGRKRTSSASSASCRSPSCRRATRRLSARRCATRSCGSRPALSVVGLLGARTSCGPPIPHTEIQPDSVLVVAGHASADRRAQRAAARRRRHVARRCSSSAPARSVRRRRGRSSGRGSRCTPSTAPRRRSRRSPADVDACSPATPPIGAARARRASSRRASVLLTTNDDAMNIYLAVYCRRLNPRPAHRQPHHARAEPRGHPSRGRRLRPELHDARHRSRDVAVARPPARAARRRRGAVLGARAASLAGQPLRESGIGSRTGLSVVALQQGDVLNSTADVRDGGPCRCGASTTWKSGAARHVREPVRSACTPALVGTLAPNRQHHIEMSPGVRCRRWKFAAPAAGYRATSFRSCRAVSPARLMVNGSPSRS